MLHCFIFKGLKNNSVVQQLLILYAGGTCYYNLTSNQIKMSMKALRTCSKETDTVPAPCVGCLKHTRWTFHPTIMK